MIPLRPLQVGDVLRGSFGVIRRSLRTTVGTALLFVLLMFVVFGGLFAAVFAVVFVPASHHQAPSVGAIVGVAALFVFAVVVVWVGEAVLLGVLTLAAARQVVGERVRLPALLRQARGRIRALTGFFLLIGAAAFVAFAVIGGLSALLIASGTTGGAAGGGALFVVGFIALEVAAVWIGVKLCLVPSVLMLERRPLRAAIARSWRLTRHRFWPTLGTILLVGLIIYGATLIVTIPFSFAGSFSVGISGHVGSSHTTVSAPDWNMFKTYGILLGIGQLVSAVVTAIGLALETAAVALVYVDLRIRAERLDVQLVRYTEQRDAGQEGLPDPFAAPDPGAAAAPLN
ncbi:hypothetical protein AX769_17955 [Frondihabitans sp. PAMC 28766]|uniref:glycerophosphoryl diester phosphodiesterase membrane domain-containing protein n=1 Tax=Frondihabitans sp. PAMC 28766 TaxID=1795630 RepID=UPI00078DF5AE|nr:glycerophosphoryl diester phosphodiesterase membrane domain-containing protein [Frondihabitans sp. PAMC 28766]AMM21685.1 hypothetical protein AX769_17955 [Frondihabitans sp. PAMC 28766]